MTNIHVSERKHWIGASESPALFGASPYTTRFELWHQKVGNIPIADISHDERVMAGQFMEPSIAAWANEKWHWPILNVKEYRQSPHIHRMGSSLDFETIDGLEPVEIKNVDNLIFRDNWEHDGDAITSAPDHMLLQVQHQLACPVAGRKQLAERGWLIACVGGNKLYRMEIPRHDAMIQRINDEVEGFWATVEANEAPDPQFDIDADAINLLYHGMGMEIADLRGHERATELAAEYLDALSIENSAKDLKKSRLAELKVLMNDAKGAIMDDGYKISAAHLKESTSVRKAHWRFSITKAREPHA